MEIITKRCVLRTLSPQDIPDLAALYTDTKTREYLGGPIDIAQAIQSLSKHHSSQSTCAFVTRLSSHDKTIGLLALAPYGNTKFNEISYQFYPQFWGTGFAHETVGAVLEYAWQDLGMTQIFAETQSANLRSCNLLQNLGMQHYQTLTRFGSEQTVYVATNSVRKSLGTNNA